jgi:phosphoribosylformylglycinamidine cyclo-ligase
VSTYRSSGVDNEGGDQLVEKIAADVVATWGSRIVGDFGGFAAGFTIPKGYERPVLMMTTDGVGTKCELARLAGRYDGIGYDLVAMIVDDLAAVGARPLALVDYLVVGQLDIERERALIASVAAACGEAGCALVGGETAQHPGVMDEDRFDIAGAAVGVVEQGCEVTGATIGEGDELIGVASPNLRSNGFSLVRSELLPRLSLDEPFPGSDRTVADVLLEPSVVYAPAVLDIVDAGGVHGMAHITGGGIPGNLIRVLPPGCSARVDVDSWQPPAVFSVIAERADVARDEMFATFNMGVGFVLVVAPAVGDEVIAALGYAGHRAWRLGEVTAGRRGVELIGL